MEAICLEHRGDERAERLDFERAIVVFPQLVQPRNCSLRISCETALTISRAVPKLFHSGETLTIETGNHFEKHTSETEDISGPVAWLEVEYFWR